MVRGIPPQFPLKTALVSPVLGILRDPLFTAIETQMPLLLFGLSSPTSLVSLLRHWIGGDGGRYGRNDGGGHSGRGGGGFGGRGFEYSL